MYGKIFSSMYDGTMYGQWEAIVTFQQLIVLCSQDGVVDMTPPAIAARTSIPIEIILKGISVLENPDPYSRTPGKEGRRIERLDEHRPWGWIIVNHKYYRDLASHEDKNKADRLRIKNKRDQEITNKINDVAECSNLSQDVANVANVAYTDTNTDTDKTTSYVETEAVSGEVEDEKSELLSTKRKPTVPYQEIVDVFHETLPKLAQVYKLTATRKAHIKSLWLDELDDIASWKHYFKHISQSDFLMGRAKPGVNGRVFVADFDFIIKPANFVKIAEEKYHGKKIQR